MTSSAVIQSPEKVSQPVFDSSAAAAAAAIDSSLSKALGDIQVVSLKNDNSTSSSPAATTADVPSSRRASTTAHTNLLRQSISSAGQPPNNGNGNMVDSKSRTSLKTTLALPSLSKPGSRANSDEGQKRTSSTSSGHHQSLHLGLPRVRSRSGDDKKYAALHALTNNGAPSPPLTGMLSPTPSGSGLNKLSSLLSGRSTPHPPTASPGLISTPSLNQTASNGGHARHPLHNAQAASATGGTPAAATPTNGGATTGNGAAISGLEASYVTKVGMSLNDAVNKVFPSPATVISTAAAGYSTIPNDAALVSYKGLCAPRVDRAREVGNMIAHELHLAVNDQYLLRSLLRSAVLKTLSIFLSRLESLIISPAADSTILSVPKTVKEAENPPQSQRFSFLILRSAWELKKGLYHACAVSGETSGPISEMPKFVRDTLNPWISKLDLLANRIWGPILTAIKDEAVNTITVQGAIEVGLCAPPTLPSPAAGGHLALPAVHNGSSSGGSRSLSLSRSSTPGPTPLTSSSTGTTGSSANLAIPNYIKDLSTMLAATSRTFAWLSVAEVDNQNWKVAIGSSVIWKMMMLYSFRRVDEAVTCTSSTATAAGGGPPSRRSSPPPSIVNGLSSATNGNAAAAASGATAHTATIPVPAAAVPKRSMSAMGISRLRGSALTAGKRSPSPPREQSVAHNAARLVVDVEIFESCIEKFVSTLSLVAPVSSYDGVNNPNSIPCSKNKECDVCKGRFIPLEVDDSDDEDELPREAMQEAMTALSSFIVVLRFLAHESAGAGGRGANPVPKLMRAIAAVDDLSLAPEICPNFIRALDLLPPLILLQTLVARIPSYYEFKMPNQLWNTSWKQYESTMKGFHTGEEWVAEVGWEILKEARRVGRRMSAEQQQQGVPSGSAPTTAAVVDEEGWLEMVKFAVVELGEVDDLEEEGYASAQASH